MKYIQRTAVIASLLGLLSSGLIACGGSKSSGSSNVVGNVAVNGNTVTSTDTVNGMALSVSMSNLTMSGYGYGYTSNSYSSGATFTISVNNSTQQISSYNVNAGQWAQTYVGGEYMVDSVSTMIDSVDVAVVVLVTVGTNTGNYCTQYKEMGMIQNMQTGAIRSVIEQVGYGTSSCGGTVLPTATSVIQSMQSIMI